MGTPEREGTGVPPEGAAPGLDELFERHRAGLERMVRLRLDRELRRRLSESDVVQEAYLEACRRFEAFAARAGDLPPSVWLRLVTGQKLDELRRRHLGAERRAVGHEVATLEGTRPGASLDSLAGSLLASATSPSDAAVRAERAEAVRAALAALDATDREVLVMRHFERRSNVEVALELGLAPSAASKRHLRALDRLERALGPGFAPPPGA